MQAIEAPIVATTVYLDVARIARRGTVHLTAGEHVLAISPLPNGLEPDSVRAAGQGERVRILGVEVGTTYIDRPPEATLDELLGQLEELDESLAALADRQEVEKARLEMLHHMRTSGGETLPRGLALGRLDLAGLQTLEAHLTQETHAAKDRLRLLNRESKDLNKKRENVKAQLDRHGKSESAQRRQIRVSVEVDTETDFTLEVSYVIEGASWTPLYDIRLTDSRVNVNYFALIRQRTGEDWQGVQLSLSTARPAVKATIPFLSPWYLGYRVFPAPAAGARAWRGLGATVHTLAQADMDEVPPPAEALEAAMPEAEVAQAQLERTGAAVTYRVGTAVDVPSDDSPRKTLVAAFHLDADLQYVAVPKLSDEVYSRAKVTNSSPNTLLPGEAAIFHGDEFVGKTQLKRTAPNELFSLPLGIEDRVRVERELTKNDVSKRLMGTTRRLASSYTVRLANYLDKPAKIVLVDQIPVSQHEQIKVSFQDAFPKPSEHSDLNILRWRVTLEPNEQREIRYGFTVEHPRDQAISGM